MSASRALEWIRSCTTAVALAVGGVLPVVAIAESTPPATRPAVQRDPAERRSLPSPKSADDLRSIERQVSAVLNKAIPATVGITLGINPGSGVISQGSGVIISKDGYILTAGHVSGTPGRNIFITLPNGKQVKGVTLGRNDDADTGMVKITEPGEYPCVELGKAADLSVGQWVVALGHPGGYQKNRPPVVRVGRVLTVTDVFLDTDCTLIGGDSGGPLLSLDGKIIGIHSRIGQTTLLNMHVPIEQFTKSWSQLASGDDLTPKPAWVMRSSASTPFLGINGADDPLGYRVTNVKQDTTAAKAGLQENDVITRINNQPIKSFTDLTKLLERKRVGDDVTIEILREGEDAPLSLKAKLGARP